MPRLSETTGQHFKWQVDEPVATITLNRPDRKNPLTFESYAELRETFEALRFEPDIRAVIITGAGGNFSSGGDVFEIIEPLTKRDMPGLLEFTRMTGAVVKAMRACPQPIIAAVPGICAGAGAILAMASDIRFGTPQTKTAFLFVRVGLAGCDMGACAILPRLIGHGRAVELLYSGRAMSAEEGERWGLLQSALCCRRGRGRGTRLCHEARHRTFIRPCHDQAADACRVGHEHRRGHRGGSRGPGRVHGNERLPARLRGLCRQARARIRGQLMADRTFLSWPFFEDSHRALADKVEAFAADGAGPIAHGDLGLDDACRALVAETGKSGLGEIAVKSPHDVRALCLIRETLARHSGLADFAFAMQGLGSGPIVLHGSDEQKARYLPRAADGSAIAAFALSEPDAGSDVAGMSTTAERDGNGFVLNGLKTWISNGGIADTYTVFARTGEAPGARGLSAFVIEAGTPGFEIESRIDVIAPHPLATLRFDNCRIDADALIGAPGEGFKIAMATLDVFRSTVGAAALGLARRALDEALDYATSRTIAGTVLADHQMTQAKLADMATSVDAAALLIYRAAWTKDMGAPRVTREASMAKMFSTEEAQKVIDMAVQMHGGLGVTVGQTVEELYREIRALRIYEGATEVQKIVIARQTLSNHTS